jgi:hypothetical protein
LFFLTQGVCITSPMMWLQADTPFSATKGSVIIYKGLLEPQYAKYEPQIDAHLAQLRTRTTAYVQDQLQHVYRLVLGAAAAAQNEPPPPSQGVTASAAGVAANLWHTYGQGALAAGARYMQSGDAHLAQNQDQHSHPSPSPNAYATGINPTGPHFPMPYASSRVPSGSNAQSGYSIPLALSDLNLPLRTPSPR